MRSAGVVVGQEGRQPSGALGAVVPHPAVGPFAQAGLDESLGLAVGLGPIGPGVGVLDAQGLARCLEGLGAIGAAIVGQQSFDCDAETAVVRHRRLQEVHGRLLFLVGAHLHEANARVVIDGDMGEFPASALDGVTTIAGDPMTGSHDATKLLGVDVQQLTRRLTLVAKRGHNRIECLQAG